MLERPFLDLAIHSLDWQHTVMESTVWDSMEVNSLGAYMLERLVLDLAIHSLKWQPGLGVYSLGVESLRTTDFESGQALTCAYLRTM